MAIASSVSQPRSQAVRRGDVSSFEPDRFLTASRSSTKAVPGPKVRTSAVSVAKEGTADALGLVRKAA